jgi:hypothetical protein
MANIAPRKLANTGFRGVFGKQLLLVGVTLTLILCQTLFFKTASNSWLDALSTKQGLWIVYFLVVYPVVERVTRKL